MGKDSSIEWTDATWNPVLGCTRVSPGCDNCYAIRQSHRMAGNPNAKIASANAGLTRIRGEGLDWTGTVRCLPERLAIPMHWKKPRRIFVNSLSDLFHHSVPFEFIDQVFAVMALCPQHTFQVLTKRPERMAEYMARLEALEPVAAWMATNLIYPAVVGIDRRAAALWDRWPLPNVWIGTSVENQVAADARIPHLLKVPAAVRFLSCEPLLGLIDLEPFLWGSVGSTSGYFDRNGRARSHGIGGQTVTARPLNALRWVICGGESGRGARPMHRDWARSLRDQCQAAGTPFHFKQNGEWMPLASADEASHYPNAPMHEFEDGIRSVRVGKKAAGRLLDGRTWDEMPEVAE